MTILLPNAEATRAGRPGPIRYQHHFPTSPHSYHGPPYAINPKLAPTRTRGPREAWGNVGQGVSPDQRAPPPKKSMLSKPYTTNLPNHLKPLWALGLKEPKMTHRPEPLRFRHAYGPRFRVSISFTGPGRTKQEFKDECDINVLMAKYLRTGQMDHVNQMLPQFHDVSEIDFQAAQNLIADAHSMFEGIPSAVRNRFDNDPGKLLDWVHNPANAKEAADLGFLDLSKCPPGYYTAPTPTPSSPPAPPAA